MPNSRIPIFTYHSIDDSGSCVSVSPAKFKEHMGVLKCQGFHTISLSKVVECIRAGRKFPEKSVAITFDDGFKNNYTVAFPILKELEFMATIFLVSGLCGRDNQWDRQTKNIPKLNLLSWNEIIEMSDRGIEFGAHTVNHADLSKLSFEKAEEEIICSKSTIQERLKKEVPFFAYTYGREIKQIRNTIKSEFSGAFSVKMELATLKSNIYSLPRIEMYYFSGNNLLSRIEKPLFNNYIRWKGMLRRVRQSVVSG